MTPPSPTPLDRNGGGSTQHAYGRLRSAILNGQLPAGQVLSQVQLANELGVSRTPLREAIRLLQREGFVDSVPNRRVRVSALSLEDLEQVYCARILLESFGVYITLPQLTDADLEALERMHDELIRAHEVDDRERFIGAMNEFRAGLFTKAGERLTTLIQELMTHAARYRTLFAQAAEEDPATLYARARSEHTALLEAARARDGATGAVLVARQLSRTVLTVIASVRPDYDPKLVRSALPFALRGQTL